MHPEIWGPSGWLFLHTITFNYPINPTQEQKTKHKELFENLINADADVNLPDDEGQTPLHYAVCLDGFRIYLESIELLLKYGADPNLEDEEGDTPFYDAFFSQHRDHQYTLIQLLIRYNKIQD